MSRLVTLEDLPLLVKAARAKAGLSLRQVAEQVGTSHTTIDRAEKDPSGRYASVQVKIIAIIGKAQIRGPLWEIES